MRKSILRSGWISRRPIQLACSLIKRFQFIWLVFGWCKRFCSRVGVVGKNFIRFATEPINDIRLDGEQTLKHSNTTALFDSWPVLAHLHLVVGIFGVHLFTVRNPEHTRSCPFHWNQGYILALMSWPQKTLLMGELWIWVYSYCINLVNMYD